MLMMTVNCVNSVNSYGRPDEVIVVEDASPFKGSSSTLEPLYSNGGVDKHIRRKENGGFPKCANTGFKEATGDIIILSNNDITFYPGWLEGILKPLEEGYDISSINVSDSDGYMTEDWVEEDGTFGSLWAMKRKVYETIGGFDETFEKGTFEDKDFALRAKEAGFKIGKYHGVVVEHVGRATMDKLYPGQEDFHESRELFKKKWGKVV